MESIAAMKSPKSATIIKYENFGYTIKHYFQNIMTNTFEKSKL